MDWIAKARLVIQFLGLLISTIRAVEEAIPGSGRGEQKLAMVRGLLEAAYALSGNAVESFGLIWPTLAQMAGVMVAGFNAVGVFQK